MHSRNSDSLPKPDSKGAWFVYGLTVLFWLVCVFPSVFIKGWFYLDEPLQLVDAMKGDWFIGPESSKSRYLPVFEGYRQIVYRMVGASVGGFYLIQSLVFLATFLLVAWLVRRATKGAVLPALLAVVGLMSFSLAETAFSLGKPEALLALLLLLYAGVVTQFELTRDKTPRAVIISSACCFLLCILAMWNKETSPAFVMFLVPLMILPTGDSTFVGRLKRYSPLFLASVAGIIAAKMPLMVARIISPPAAIDTYTNFEVGVGTILGNLQYYVKQLRDFFPVVVMIFIILIIAFRQHRASREYRLCAATGAVAVCYILGLLVWRWGCVYYSYPPQLLASMSFVIGIGLFLASSGWSRRFAVIACLMFVGLKVAALVPFIYISNVQKIESEVYSHAVKSFAALPEVRERSGAGSEVRLYVENWPQISEQPLQTELYLKGLLGINAKVIGAAEFVTGDGSRDSVLTTLFDTASISITDPRIKPRVGDHVLTFEQNFPGFFNARAVSPCTYGSPQMALHTGIEWVPVASFSRSLTCPTALSPNPAKMIPKSIGSGYTLHRIVSIPGARDR